MSGVRDRQEVSGPVGNAGATGAARVQTPRQRFAAEAAGILQYTNSQINGFVYSSHVRIQCQRWRHQHDFARTVTVPDFCTAPFIIRQ